MEQDGQIIRGLCYACFSGAATPVDEKIMTEFANAVSPASVRIEKSFVDKRNKKTARNRPEWNALLEECSIEGIDYVVIPAMSMLSYHLQDAVDVAREVRFKYGINIHFLYEDIFTGSKTTDQELYVGYFSAIEYDQRRKSNRKSLEQGYSPFWELRERIVNSPIGAVAYIGFLEKKKMCDNETIVSALNRIMCDSEFTVKEAYSDRGRKGKFAKKDGWIKALQACNAPEIGLLIVSSAEVVGESMMDIVSFTKHIKERHGVETYFLLEDIYTADKDYEEKIVTHCSSVECIERLAKRKEKMKAVFREIECDHA